MRNFSLAWLLALALAAGLALTAFAEQYAAETFERSAAFLREVGG